MAFLNHTSCSAVCATGAYVPRALLGLHPIRPEHLPQDVPVLVTGLALSLVNGFSKGEIPLIAANGHADACQLHPPLQNQARIGEEFQ
jgi:hypothetical protein